MGNFFSFPQWEEKMRGNKAIHGLFLVDGDKL